MYGYWPMICNSQDDEALGLASLNQLMKWAGDYNNIPAIRIGLGIANNIAMREGKVVPAHGLEPRT